MSDTDSPLPPAAARGAFEVHTEARGAHWVGWVTRAGSETPERSIRLIAATEPEAEARARAWAERMGFSPAPVSPQASLA